MAKRTIENVDVDDTYINKTKKQRVEDTQYGRTPQISAARQQIRQGYADDDRKRKERKAAPLQDRHEYPSSSQEFTVNQEMSDDDGEAPEAINSSLEWQVTNNKVSDETATQPADAPVAEAIDSLQQGHDVANSANEERNSLLDGSNDCNNGDLKEGDDVVERSNLDIELFGDDGADEVEYDDAAFENAAARAKVAHIYEAKEKKAQKEADKLANEPTAEEKALAKAKADRLSLDIAWNAPYKEDKKLMKGWKKALLGDLGVGEDKAVENDVVGKKYFIAPTALYNHKHASFSNALFQALVPILDLRDLEALCTNLKIDYKAFAKIIPYHHNAELCRMDRERCRSFAANAKKNLIGKGKIDLLPYFIEAMRLTQHKAFHHRPEADKWLPYHRSIYLFPGFFACLGKDLDVYHATGRDSDPAIYMERIFDELAQDGDVKDHLEGLFGVERHNGIICPNCNTQQGDCKISLGFPKGAKEDEEFTLAELLAEALEDGEPSERRCYVCQPAKTGDPKKDKRICNAAGRAFNASSNTAVLALPEVFAVKIERGDSKKLQSNHVELPLPGQQIPVDNGAEGLEYELISVVKHDLNKAQGGQYRTYVQSGDKWFCSFDEENSDVGDKDDGLRRRAKVNCLGYGKEGFSSVNRSKGHETCLVFLRAVEPHGKPTDEQKMPEEEVPAPQTPEREKPKQEASEQEVSNSQLTNSEVTNPEATTSQVTNSEVIKPNVPGRQECKRKVPRAHSPEDESDQEVPEVCPSQEEDELGLADVLGREALMVKKFFPKLPSTAEKRRLGYEDSDGEYDNDEWEERECRRRQAMAEQFNAARNRFAPVWEGIGSA